MSDLNRCVTVVNHNTAVISKLKNYLVFIQREFLRYTAFYDQKLRVLEQFVNRLTVRQDIEVTLGHLEEIGSDFLTAQDYWLHRKDNLEAGQLTEILLPTEVLRSVLETAAPTLTTIVEPVQWYYDNLNVQPLHFERSLVFRVNLPIVETTPYRYLQFAVWPIPLQSGYLHLTLPYSVLHETVQNQVVFYHVCVGTSPIVCSSHALHDADQHQCINRLLKSEPAYDKSCYLHFSRFNPDFPVAFKNAPIITLPEKGDILLQTDINVHVLITHGVAVTLRCQGHPAVYETVPAGVYRLSLNYPCDLKSQLWTINSQFNYVYNVTLDSSIQFELPYNSYMSPLLEMNLTHEQSNFTMFADEQEIDLQLTDLKPVEYPTAISWDFDWLYTFALACLVLMIVFGI